MKMNEEAIQAIILALVAGTVPAVLLKLLDRKNANKKLNIDVEVQELSVTDQQMQTYKDLMNELRTELAASKTDRAKQAEDIGVLWKRADASERREREALDILKTTNGKLEVLRDLFKGVMDRSGTEMTPEEVELYKTTTPLLPHVEPQASGQ